MELSYRYIALRFICGICSAAAFSIPVPALAEELTGHPEWSDWVEQLDSDAFAEREQAQGKLLQLPVSALQWVETRLGRSEGRSLEHRRRLTRVVSHLRLRKANLRVERGTQVRLDFEHATPAQVLDELYRQAGGSLNPDGSEWAWESAAAPKPFQYQGSFWGAIDSLAEAMPPSKLAAQDSLLKASFNSWKPGDLNALSASDPAASAGVFRIRDAGIAVANSGKPDAFGITLMPAVEPSYEVLDLSVSLIAIRFDDGSALSSGKLPKRWSRKKYETHYSPAESFHWVLSREKMAREGCKTFEVDVVADLTVQRLTWHERAIPAKPHQYHDLNAISRFHVKRKNGSLLELGFEGSGRRPATLFDRQRYATSLIYLDDTGEAVPFRSRGTSSGPSSLGWRRSFRNEFALREPSRFRVLLPAESRRTILSCTLKGLAVPGTNTKGSS